MKPLTCACTFFKTKGFTEWSDNRTPSDVFTLLQTVYGRFDKLARKRRVFKVETIGDCYLAVTGLPDPQADHALIMAKFAHDCILEMNETTRNKAILTCVFLFRTKFCVSFFNANLVGNYTRPPL